MDPVRNPYSPGAGTPPPALVGRDTERTNFDVAIRRLALGRPARSLMLTGLRGVGKTVLLYEFGQIARSHSWIHQHLEAAEDTQFEAAIATLARKSLLQLSVGARLADRTQQALGVLKSFQLRWNLPDGGSLDFTIDPVPGRADSGALDEDLADLLSAVAEMAKGAQKGVLFTLDEVQYVPKPQLGALIVGLHRISQNQLPLMVAGAGLPSLPALAGEAKSYAERLFAFSDMGSLTEGEAQTALTTPAEAEGVMWESDALSLVIDRTEGYPYFLQEFGKQTWDAAQDGNTISRAAVENAVPIAIDELDSGFFRVRIDRTTDTERAYLRAMATLGDGPYNSGEVAAGLGKTTQQVGPVRDNLIKRGLCYSPRHGVIAFTVPMFDQFVRRHLGAFPA